MNAFGLLENSPLVLRFEVVDLKTWEQGFYLRIDIEFVNHSKLFVREYVDETERRYSYHWQTQENRLIRRWDNAPHHPQLDTFPSHCHQEGVLAPSAVMSLEEVLEEVRKSIG